MTGHRTSKPSKKGKETGEKRHFPSKPLSKGRLEILREKHTTDRLSADESRALILAGNANHVKAVVSSKIAPRQRYQKILDGLADYLVIRCSDARVNKTDSESDPSVGLHIYIAGNVVPSGKTVSKDEMLDAISKVRPNGIVIVTGHCNCGAVAECAKWTKGGKEHTGSEPLDNLLQDIVGVTPAENALGQHNRLQELTKQLGKDHGCMLYDWETGTVSILAHGESDLTDLLADSFRMQHKRANADGTLAERLADQKPHAIAIGYSLLPFSISTITGALQNEIFNTTGSEGGLDDFDAASILYAVEHLGVKHIPFIAPFDADLGTISKMFDKWEKDLRGMTVHGKPLMANMLDSGKLVISRLGYDLKTGALKPF